MNDKAPSYPLDPAGVLASDVHRQVLGHISTPDDGEGYQLTALGARLDLSAHIPLGSGSVDQIDAVLADLASDGLAHDNGAGVWQMTPEGFEKLTGPATDEAIASAPAGAATIGQPTPLEPAKAKGKGKKK